MDRKTALIITITTKMKIKRRIYKIKQSSKYTKSFGMTNNLHRRNIMYSKLSRNLTNSTNSICTISGVKKRLR